MLEDAQIIQIYWDRDQEAISETDRKYGRYCAKIARSILADDGDTEECVNDTYYRTWDSIPPQRPLSFPPFLGKIVRNLALDRYRYNTAQKRNRHMDVLLSELENCLPAAGGAEEALEAGVVTEIINRYLDGLSRRKRILFVRRYWYSQSIRELAETFGMTEGQTKSALYRLRGGLREALEKEGVSL